MTKNILSMTNAEFKQLVADEVRGRAPDDTRERLSHPGILCRWYECLVETLKDCDRQLLDESEKLREGLADVARSAGAADARAASVRQLQGDFDQWRSSLKGFRYHVESRRRDVNWLMSEQKRKSAAIKQIEELTAERDAAREELELGLTALLAAVGKPVTIPAEIRDQVAQRRWHLVRQDGDDQASFTIRAIKSGSLMDWRIDQSEQNRSSADDGKE